MYYVCYVYIYIYNVTYVHKCSLLTLKTEGVGTSDLKLTWLRVVVVVVVVVV